jgi:arylsulfatase A-like enzyme
MSGPSETPRSRTEQALPLAAGVFAGFALLAAVDALMIALLVPPPRAGAALRLLHHVFDAAETLGVGAVAAALAACAGLLRGRWAATLVCGAMWAPIAYVAIGDDLRRSAALSASPRLELAVFGAYLALLFVGFPVIHAVGTLLSGSRRLRLPALGVALGALIGDHYVLRDDYAGIHAVVALAGVAFTATLIAPLAARAARALALTGPGRAALGATAAFALFGLAYPPPNTVRYELFRRSCAVAPWALAYAVWPAPRLHGPVPSPSSPWLRDRSADPPVPPSSPRLLPDSPVVVLVSIDAVRAEAVENPANDGIFPTLAALKRSGVVFTRASAPGSQTALSLSTLFSGRYFSELYWSRHGTGRTRFDYPAEDPSPRFPALLSERGVDTASFGSLVFLGGEFGVARGFREDHVVVRTDRHARAKELVDPLLARLRRAGPEPLFAYTHMMEPHAPYDRGRKDGSAYERYLSEIAVADDQLGRVWRTLQQRFDDRWALIVTADHGEAFGEHQTFEHGKTLYQELVHVPLIVAGPRIAPRTVDERVGLVDLGPTILDLFGVETPATFEGQSLAPLLAGEAATLTRPLLAEGRLRRELTLPDGLEVIDDPRREVVEVYDLAADPGETLNLFDRDPARADTALAALRAFFDVHALRRAGYRPPYKL